MASNVQVEDVTKRKAMAKKKSKEAARQRELARLNELQKTYTANKSKDSRNINDILGSFGDSKSTTPTKDTPATKPAITAESLVKDLKKKPLQYIK